MPQIQDIVAKLPDPIVHLQRLGGRESLDYTVQPGFVAKIHHDNEFFVHTRAMIPLKDVQNGVGFGLWVKISQADFELYLRAVNEDDLYSRFTCVGSLANTWPGFPGTYGDKVRVRTIHLTEKPYITQYLSEPKDVLMRVSLLAQLDDQETKEYVRNLAMSYLIGMSNFADAPHSGSVLSS